MKKIQLKIEGMHCASCAMSIDGDLEDTEGVSCAKTNYARSQTEVEFDPGKITEDGIKKIIKSSGYTAALL